MEKNIEIPKKIETTEKNDKGDKIEKPDKIDNLDKQILNIVLRNARIPSKDIALECGVSRAAIHQRLQKLMETNVIVGSGYYIDPRKLGFNTCTYIGINLASGPMYLEVVEQLKAIPEVVECHYTTGPYSLLIKLYARDNLHLMELLNTHIQQIKGVSRTETLISLDKSFDRQLTLETKPVVSKRGRKPKKRPL